MSHGYAVCVSSESVSARIVMPMAVTIGLRSDGAGGEGPVVECVGLAGEGWPWALVSHPLSVMTSVDGAAFVEYLLEAGDGRIFLLVAPNDIDPAQGVATGGSLVMICCMIGGRVSVDESVGRRDTPGWGAPMAPGETVRVRCVTATRIVSVVWRGREHELAPLPATWDVTRYCFGVIVAAGNTVRLTEASAPCASQRDVRRVFVWSIHGRMRVHFCRCLRLFAFGFLERSLCNCARFMWGLTLAHRSTLHRATHWIRRAHARDVSGGSDPRIGRTRRHYSMAVRARAALGCCAGLRASPCVLDCATPQKCCPTRARASCTRRRMLLACTGHEYCLWFYRELNSNQSKVKQTKPKQRIATNPFHTMSVSTAHHGVNEAQNRKQQRAPGVVVGAAISSGDMRFASSEHKRHDHSSEPTITRKPQALCSVVMCARQATAPWSP
jgi:hypothetical protein